MRNLRRIGHLTLEVIQMVSSTHIAAEDLVVRYLHMVLSLFFFLLTVRSAATSSNGSLGQSRRDATGRVPHEIRS